MPKSLTVDPNEVRQPGKIKIKDIPVNAYTPDFKKEEKKFGKDRLKKALYDMMIIREFESMLNSIKTQGAYEGIEYNHKGPAHLSTGQESSSVGQALNLGIDDFIFGSHRSHGEILAKSFSAISKLDDNALNEIMKNYMGGNILKAVEKGHKGETSDLAEDFILYGTLAEIFEKANGINMGLGGSMHAFFKPFGSMPNNAIVGGSGDVSVGSALFKRINRKPGIVIANIGDASMGCGPVWEGMMLAAMDQYRTLWDKEIGGAPPILFNFFNNFYGMGGQTAGETMGFGVLARVGAGVNPENMHSERVDGYNPLAVADAIDRKRKILEEGKGPALLDTVTYRIAGHSPSDASSYRTKDELELWEEHDCIESYSDYLKENEAISDGEVEDLRAQAKDKIKKACERAVSMEISPRLNSRHVEQYMFSNEQIDTLEEGREPEVLLSMEENPRVKQISRKSRFGLDENGKDLPKTKVLAMRDALFEAMLYRFYKDPTMVAYGEENRDWGGAFAVYRGLTEALPYHRLFNSSISEGAIVGSAVGYAMSGGRAVVELMYCDFMGRAGDEIFNQLSKWQAMSAGLLRMPVVLRVSVGSKYGAQHSQDWTALTAHIPGLKVMFPATPYDAKGMLNLALHGSDPVVFFESQRLYDKAELFEAGGVPKEYYEVEEGEPAVRKSGSDVTIVTIGATLYKAMEAAEDLENKYNMSAEVIDARFINPLNYEIIVESVKKTGKIVLSSDACDRNSFLHTMASNISRLAFDYLDGPVAVVGSRNWITPGPEMEEAFFPQKEWILDTIHESIQSLSGHEVTTVQTDGEVGRRNRLGV
ncbi:MAG: dehydrogenase [Spirochaetales bacterium]|nr:dehydrogenase [Spirochaetales bacterium]